jgi:hypothetical protein
MYHSNSRHARWRRHLLSLPTARRSTVPSSSEVWGLAVGKANVERHGESRFSHLKKVDVMNSPPAVAFASASTLTVLVKYLRS